MPNWVSNIVYLKHPDRAMLQRAYDALERGALLEEFLPVPEELKAHDPMSNESHIDPAAVERLIDQYGSGNWYDWCVENWGTKWDVGEAGLTSWEDDLMLSTAFDSAWSPPVGAFRTLESLGFEVLAYYYEPGMVFAGIFEHGCDDQYTGWSTSTQAREILPQQLDDTFAISDQLEEFELEEMEDLQRWIHQATNNMETENGN